MDKGNNAVIGIDFQIDFCVASMALPVPNAVEDCLRFAAFISDNSARIEEVYLTHDCHDSHIATTDWWIDKNGNHPNPYQVLTYDEIKDSKWRINTMDQSLIEWGIEYARRLEEGDEASKLEAGRYVLTTWPLHCQIGSTGAAIMDSVLKAAVEWRQKKFYKIQHLTKGSNPFTEHYSAMKAAVVRPDDISTGLNETFISLLQEHDTIYVGGEALNFCLRETMLDIIRNFDSANVRKIVLLEDCTSAIPDQPGDTYCQERTDEFMKEALAAGMRVAKSTEI